MFALGLQGHQIDDIHDADFQTGKLPAENVDRGQRLKGRNVSSASHYYIRLNSLIVAGPLPDTNSFRAMLHGRIHVEILQRGLLTGDDDVNVMAAAQAVIRNRKQRVCVGRQIDANNFGFLVDDMIDEAWVLMAKAIMVLPPHVRSE